MSGEGKIEIRGVEKSFAENHVLRGVDLRIPAGKITAIIGRSGEGKSVLLKHMMGLLRPDRGQSARGRRGRCHPQGARP